MMTAIRPEITGQVRQLMIQDGVTRSDDLNQCERAILDWVRKVGGKTLHGEGTAATKTWVKKIETWLWNGEVRKILQRLREQQTRTDDSDHRRALAELITYLTNQDALGVRQVPGARTGHGFGPDRVGVQKRGRRADETFGHALVAARCPGHAEPADAMDERRLGPLLDPETPRGGKKLTCDSDTHPARRDWAILKRPRWGYSFELRGSRASPEASRTQTFIESAVSLDRPYHPRDDGLFSQAKESGAL